MQNVTFIVCILIILQKLVLNIFFVRWTGAVVPTHDRRQGAPEDPGGATSGTVTGSLWVPFKLASPLLEAGIAIEKQFFPPQVSHIFVK